MNGCLYAGDPQSSVTAQSQSGFEGLADSGETLVFTHVRRLQKLDSDGGSGNEQGRHNH